MFGFYINGIVAYFRNVYSLQVMDLQEKVCVFSDSFVFTKLGQVQKVMTLRLKVKKSKLNKKK